MNLQEIFDTVVEHLREQNEKSIDKDFECVYRSPEGLKCAAGCLIPDEYYSQEMENVIWFDLVKNFDLPNYLKNEISNQLVSKLQYIHDYSPIEDWEEEFKFVADLFKLIYKEPSNV